eukprot:CAMPEP_0174255394 /NCGR_PEP_ID=MMETSP0439-20130205/4728_1 /TAXON_ID=0 /ORGANISM="Stereomyxa ramosa, Strain Chinc5" /LENGTH=32 /DNA_ID= /DNA_START= /DNA_END= /DNA_ORIENTATION=
MGTPQPHAQGMGGLKKTFFSARIWSGAVFQKA